MNKLTRRVALCCSFLCIAVDAVAAQHTQWLVLRSHDAAPTLTPSRSGDNGAPLRLGVSAPDYPPFDISTAQEYEGLSADYATLVGHALGRPIAVQRYPSRDQAIDALRDGRIDLLASANGYEAVQPQLALSSAYAVDRPVLVTRTDDDRPLDDGLAGRRLSVVNHYLPAAYIKAHYPEAIVQYYPSYQNALNAVAFEQADVFLGDTISTHYQMDQGLLNNVHMANFSRDEASGFSFAVRRDNPALLARINQALDDVSVSQRQAIFQRWSGASDLLLTDRKLQLSRQEQRWLATHPSVRVVVDDSFAPLTFFDRYGNLRGISADLLELIRLRTGLQFEIQRATGVNDMLTRVSQGNADLVAAIIPSDQREQRLQFSRPYLSNSFVLLTAKDSRLNDLGDLDGRRLAITRGNPLVPWLQEHFPHVQLEQTDDGFASLDRLAQGQVEGAVSSLVVARHLLASPLFQDRLAIRSTVGSVPATFVLATAHEATELASILDKALLSIDPAQMTALIARWRNYAPGGTGYWRNYHRLILQIVAGATLLLSVSLLWILYMKRQIRQRLRAERALSDQFQFMRTLVDGTPHPIYVRDRAGLLISCNDSYLKTFDARREDVLGKTVQQGVLPDPEQARAYHLDYLHVMAQGEPLVMDRPLRIGSHLLSIYHWILPYRDSAGQVQGVIGGWIDISERRQLLEDLRQAKDQADQANRAKSTFLTTMSHEIRTPMNALIGMLELAMRRAEQNQLDSGAIEVAYSSARDLLALIGDILDVSRIEAGHLTLALERTQAPRLVSDVARIFEGLARDKGLPLHLRLPTTPQPDVVLDPLRLKQVLSNLVSNAIKFTDQGQVTLELTMTPGTKPGTRQVQVQVTDTGIGITGTDRQRLFQPFAQVDPDSARARSGTGLGLMISKHLCHLMGASIELHSEPGQGTQVHINLVADELAAQAPAPAQAPPAVNLHGLRVLVVDDHPANRLLMTQQLDFLGLSATTADNGDRGLQVALDSPFDVLLVDCNMPGIDGYELTRRLRQQEQQQGLRPRVIFGYTASAQDQERERCLAAGMNDCLFKPMGLADLTRALATVAVQLHGGVLDLSQLAPLTGGEPKLERRLLQQVLDSCMADRQALLAADTPSALHDLAHRIKGAARIVAATTLTQACEALEKACQDGASTVSATPVATAMEALERALKRHLATLPDN
ncbi:putative two-component system sensor kinase [Pseudomonas sp. M47T1]|uniref:transporter substrate-binding domain-containing protein n=1 Tax=Pseudomonas sp. M47T1 TaxID=1179778 RepID=UPI0002607B25|nr:transporter substrate-binding domain-containing protein [Pseudomonas sp. M47T1]EIK96751.1 putative two-component system sensor kinase [Pseudomonas sp. M47T1]